MTKHREILFFLGQHIAELMRVAYIVPAFGSIDDEPSTQHHHTKFIAAIKKSDVRSNLNALVKTMKDKTQLNSEVLFFCSKAKTGLNKQHYLIQFYLLFLNIFLQLHQ